MEEVTALLQRVITVSTSSGKSYTGVLSGVDSHSLNMCLTDAKDETGRVVHKVFLNGSTVTQMLSTEKPFNLVALGERLERVFPRMVKVNESAGVIVVMERIRVSEKGIIEGTGPAAERVQRVYDEFMREQMQT